METKLENPFALLTNLEGDDNPPSAAEKPPSPTVEDWLSATKKAQRSNGRPKGRRNQEHYQNQDQDQCKREESKVDKKRKLIKGVKIWPILRKSLTNLEGDHDPTSAARKPTSAAVEERLSRTKKASPRPPSERSNGRKKARRTQEHKKDQNEL
ncbi:hypothetical protein Pfo_028345 [Paulownia fortunei]|nr:hypothetical protein Pfo_028345 [Paulownia fortunei]